jgi:hypothetical protein
LAAFFAVPISNAFDLAKNYHRPVIFLDGLSNGAKKPDLYSGFCDQLLISDQNGF